MAMQRGRNYSADAIGAGDMTGGEENSHLRRSAQISVAVCDAQVLGLQSPGDGEQWKS